MKGMEIWNVIAPILAENLPLNSSENARDIYLETYLALKKFDENGGRNENAK